MPKYRVNLIVITHAEYYFTEIEAASVVEAEGRAVELWQANPAAKEHGWHGPAIDPDQHIDAFATEISDIPF
jgi:hypothetical protein